MLMGCYTQMYEYKLEIYGQIGNVLLVDNVLTKDKKLKLTANDNEEALKPLKKRKKIETLHRMFGTYLQENYETLLEASPMDVLRLTNADNSNNEKKETKSKVEQVVQQVSSKYKEKMEFLSKGKKRNARVDASLSNECL